MDIQITGKLGVNYVNKNIEGGENKMVEFCCDQSYQCKIDWYLEDVLCSPHNNYTAKSYRRFIKYKENQNTALWKIINSQWKASREEESNRELQNSQKT